MCSFFIVIQPTAGTPTPEVHIFGAAHVIDGIPSMEWMETQLRSREWGITIEIHASTNRSTVLAMMQEEGVLLVSPSLQENLSYVLAEAAVRHVPLLTFDVGGSSEVLDLQPDDQLTLCNET